MEVDRKTRLQRELFLRVLVLSKPSPGIARAMSEAIQDVEVAAGSTLYKTGDDPDAQYWITSGKVDLVSDDDNDEPFHFGEGAVVGILDVILERQRARTAIAVTDVQAMKLPAEEWLEILEDHPDYLTQLRRDVPSDLFANFQVTLGGDAGFPAAVPDDGSAAWLEMSAIDKLVALREVSCLERASVQALVELSRIAQVQYLSRGETLFEVGAFGDKVFVVCAGVVEIARQSETTIRARFGRGQMLFDTVAMTAWPAQFQAIAETDAIVMVFTQSDIDDACEDHFDLARSIMRASALERDRLMALRGRRQKAAAQSTLPPAPQATIEGGNSPDVSAAE